ncbi:hypothetical protein HPS59_00330 [Prevotella sp. PCJ2]|nr:hypothetical protein [Prevotella sp. PCJ2]
MKRTGNLWPLICDRANIEKAASDAISGRRLTKKERQFVENRPAMLDALEQSLVQRPTVSARSTRLQSKSQRSAG